MPLKPVLTNLNGNFRTGTVDTANVSVSFSKSGYITKNLTKNFARGAVLNQTIKLVPVGVGLAKSVMANDIKVSPNPANDFFYIQNAFTNSYRYTYKLFDVYHKQVGQGDIQDDNQKVVIQNLSHGFYFVSILEDNKEIVKVKLLK
jgi:nucleoside recognition membrane protein YjiH